MTTYVLRCLIVPADYAPLARALCAGLSEGGAGDGMFATPVSSTGALPATHFIAQGMIDAAMAAMLPLTTYTTDAQGVTTSTSVSGQPETIVALAKGQVTLAQCNALLAAIDVTTQTPFAALARKSLKLIQQPL